MIEILRGQINFKRKIQFFWENKILDTEKSLYYFWLLKDNSSPEKIVDLIQIFVYQYNLKIKVNTICKFTWTQCFLK